MATRQQIRTRCYAEFGQVESTSDFTQEELNGFISEGILFAATHIKWPTDKVEIQVERDTANYTLPSDFLLIMDAYFGNTNSKDDIRPLDVVTREQMREINPRWLDETSDTSDRPLRICKFDSRTVTVDPKPNAEHSASGKKIHMIYLYYPQSLNSDDQEPDLPLPYHDLLPIFVAHKAYGGKLKDPNMASYKLKEFTGKLDLIKPQILKETEQQHWVFGSDDSAYLDASSGGLEP